MKAAIDIGGTFTDVIVIDGAGAIASAKIPTEQNNLSQCFLSGVKAAIDSAGASAGRPEELLYSTTLALNALLTHELPRIGLIVNAGFRELMETARLPNPMDELADTRQPMANRLVSLEFVREIKARLDADGSVRRAVDELEVVELAHWYRKRDITIVAVSLLHSYLDPAQEREVAHIFSGIAPDIEVVLSSEVLPELREYERTLAACLNASLMPAMKDHVGQVVEESDFSGVPLLVMKSSGGLSSSRLAMKKPLTTALSGPSAAVVGMAWLGQRIGFDDLITLDIGGTSTDVALVGRGRYALTKHGEIAGFPFKTPMIDVLTIGAGGGSIASRASDERWHVGPASAGADPGPVCYVRGGTDVTVTDAQLVLGRLPDALLGGRLPLDRDAASKALDAFGKHRAFNAVQSARGILEIATHNMCGAIRRISVQRGHDPKDYALLAMGGAGPLHAAELANLLGIETIVVPPQPGLAAAFGLLVADVKDDFVQAFGQLETDLNVNSVQTIFNALERSAEQFFADEEIPTTERAVWRQIDMRYAGLSNEMSVEVANGPVSDLAIRDAIETYHRQFHQLTGHSHEGQEAVELVNLRVTAVGQRTKPEVPAYEAVAGSTCAPRASRPVAYLDHEGFIDSAVYDRASLTPGVAVDGPAVIEQFESTVIVPPEFSAELDALGNLTLRSQAR